jgi:hypothetical protein
MSSIYMVNVGNTFRLEKEWSPVLRWEKRNLVLFRNLKLTGQKPIVQGHHKWVLDSNGNPQRDANGKMIMVEYTRNETVKNPLFRNDDGSYTPVIVNFPKDTVIEVSKYNTGYLGKIYEIWLKVLKCSDSRFTGRCVSVTMDEFNGADIEILTNDDYDDEL